MSNRRKSSRWKSIRHSKIFRCALVISGVAVFILLVSSVLLAVQKQRRDSQKKREKILPNITIETKLLEPNPYSRPQTELKKVRGVVVHYTANPGTDAMNNRDYFNNLPKINKNKKKKKYVSSHFVIGLEGQIVQCIPLNEIAYASNDRNSDTISIECCHPKVDGKFNEATYQALKELVTYLCLRFDLSSEDVIRHYDVTGKQCPLYYVKNEDKWLAFRTEIENGIELYQTQSKNKKE